MGIVYKGQFPKLDEALKDFPAGLEKCREKAIGYISKEALMVAFADRVVKNTGNETLLTWNDAEDIVCNFQTADVREVVHGKWIVDSIASNIFRCSVCGQDAPVEPTGGTEYKSYFCPNCGARMDKEN